MRLLFDTNMVLDVLLDRGAFAGPATRSFALVEDRRVHGMLGATTITTVYYLIAKALGRRRAAPATKRLLALFDVAPVGRSVLDAAVDRGWTDFEDAVLHEAAVACDAQGIVTRNRSDFRRAVLPIYDPEELLRMLQVFER